MEKLCKKLQNQRVLDTQFESQINVSINGRTLKEIFTIILIIIAIY